MLQLHCEAKSKNIFAHGQRRNRMTTCAFCGGINGCFSWCPTGTTVKWHCSCEGPCSEYCDGAFFLATTGEEIKEDPLAAMLRLESEIDHWRKEAGLAPIPQNDFLAAIAEAVKKFE
jgi:hypothetical protein